MSAKQPFQSYSFLDIASRLRILADCAPSNAQVCRDYFPTLPEGTPLFPEPLEAGEAAPNTSAGAVTLLPLFVKMAIESREKLRQSRVLRIAHKLDAILGKLSGRYT